MKGRDFSKRLAFLVRDFDSLREYVEITDEQINFLKAYPHPWSVVLKKKSTWTLPDYLNQDDYDNISFRVAEKCIPANIHNNLQYPLFLTSANLSGKPESKTFLEAKESFPQIAGIDGGICDRPPSDIFSFSEGNQVFYFRKNSK